MEIVTKPAILVALCALAYAASTFAMKTVSVSPSVGVLVLLGMTLGAAVIAEITLLQRQALGITYITILGAETMIVLLVAAAIGEGLGPREVVGAAMVVGGTAVMWL